MQVNLGLEHFAACLEQDFELLDAPSTLCLRLVEARTTGSESAERPFSLLFHGPGSPQLGQATYRLRHPRLGELDLFLVPVGREPERMSYEAVFN